MLGYYVEVPGMTQHELQQFVRQRMLSTDELLTKAKESGLPVRCTRCGEPLRTFIEKYDRIPSVDLTIRFGTINGASSVVQLASGGCGCRRIKDGLRRIVQRHLASQLRSRGYDCSIFVV